MAAALLECSEPSFLDLLTKCGHSPGTVLVETVVVVRVACPEVDVPGVELTVLETRPEVARL